MQKGNLSKSCSESIKQERVKDRGREGWAYGRGMPVSSALMDWSRSTMSL